MSPTKSKKKPGDHLRSALPLLKELVRPRRGKLALGFFLMIISRVCSLVAARLYQISGGQRDRQKHQESLLKPLVGVVFAAAIIQGLTSFSLTQLLSTAKASA